MAGVTFTYDDAGWQAKYKAVLDLAHRPVGVMNVVGRAGSNFLKAWFLRKDSTEPSDLGSAGGRRQHFWKEIGQSVQQPKIDEKSGTIEISITDPRISQKVFGGTITPKRAQYLTIPAAPLSYGRSARVFTQETGIQLFPIFMRGTLLLVGRESAKAGLTTFYVLQTSVTQQPWPGTLPKAEEILPTLLKSAESAVSDQLAGL